MNAEMAPTTDPAAGERLFWELAEPLLAAGSAERSTMMGYPCLRVRGAFFAGLERGTGNLILKLPAERVRELVESGRGAPFAPNGRVFREWVAFDAAERGGWGGLMLEARAFVAD